MTATQSRIRPLLAVTLACVFLQACEDSGSESTSPKLGVNGTYLHVSAPDFYFGTKDVGSKSTQNIQISNRGADVYPLKSITVRGENADEFSAQAIDEIVLKPTEAISVGITFQPITDGRKFADFIVSYDTLQKVDDSVNVNEQSYYEAKDLENSGDYLAAKRRYNDYIDGQPVTSNKQRAAIKLPIIEESTVYGDGNDFDLYLSAMDLRDIGQFEAANTELAVISTLYGDGYLGDDALYLKGYIQLMDEEKFADALTTMQQLRKQYPDSTYYDTALYSEAIAQQGLGNLPVAKEILLDLRYRHTGVDALGITLAKDNLVSRLWFDRANTALDSMGSV
ncbi:MAG: TolA-binding protein [Granulosicoccus sp.]|jgi:TolA-binding protein